MFNLFSYFEERFALVSLNQHYGIRLAKLISVLIVVGSTFLYVMWTYIITLVLIHIGLFKSDLESCVKENIPFKIK